MKLLIPLLQQMTVFAVIAYLYSKTSGFKTLLSPNRRTRDILFTYLFFSSITIFGSYMGLPIKDALANTRAIGAVTSGLIGGPIMGGAVGITAGIHRFMMGGFTDFACGLSTTVEGLIGGFFHYYLVKKSQDSLIYSYKVAFAATFISEAAQMLIILAVAKPFTEALALVEIIALPMILSNSVGAALFISILGYQKGMVDEYGALFSKKALRVADKTLHLFSKGLTDDVPVKLAKVLKDEIGVSAVAVTDKTRILAFEGEGSRHHKVGTNVTSPHTLSSVETGEVVFAYGITSSFKCPIDANCELNSVLVVPLKVDGELIGTIQLFESKNKSFLNINKSFGEGLVNLMSTQLLIAKYAEQKTLLVESELKLLQAQINPHFLFNTLNTIVSVTRVSPDKAIELIQHLSNMFRKNLKRQDLSSKLEEDLDHVNSYLKIEKARFGDQLDVKIDIDPAIMQMKIPCFTLQPLIENAIKHGMVKVIDRMEIVVKGYIEGHLCVLEVRDNAGAFCHEKTEGSEQGLGLAIVDKRVKNMFGSIYGISVDCVKDESTVVRISIPLSEDSLGLQNSHN
ncbi:MAG: sensor histidine kinase [Denitrovibrio sp.]|nr:MAG: sensor histidine kinase [Denitrovibrio sp.]